MHAMVMSHVATLVISIVAIVCAFAFAIVHKVRLRLHPFDVLLEAFKASDREMGVGIPDLLL